MEKFMNTKCVFRFTKHYGRLYDLEAIFIATRQAVIDVIGKDFHYYPTDQSWDIEPSQLKEEDFKIITDDEKVVNMMEEFRLCVGINPLECLSID